MTTPSWIKVMLRHRGIPFEELHHPETLTSPEVAGLAHLGGDRFAKAVVAVVDGLPAVLVLPASRDVDLGLVRAALCADEARLATEQEVARQITGCEAGAVPPLRGWKGVPVVMDRALKTEGEIVFDAGTHADAIRLSFRDWYALVRPYAADISVQPEPALA